VALYRNHSLAAMLVAFALTGCVTPLHGDKPAIGPDTYTYRFVLNDAHTGKPLPKHLYAVMVDGYPLPFARGGKGVYQGVTDRAGRTARFHLPVQIPPEKWKILERVGEGPNGQAFQMVSATGLPLADHAYQMAICLTPAVTHTGYTDAQGYVAFAASKEEAKLRVLAAHGYSDAELIAQCVEMKDVEVPK
jgi:hypothetical protein